MTSTSIKFAFLATMLLAGSANVAPAASFDCEKPELAADEKAICDNRALNDADVRMVTTFELLSGMMAMGSRGSMQDDQVEWLSRRQSCGAEIDCIRAAYDERMKELLAIYDTIERPI